MAKYSYVSVSEAYTKHIQDSEAFSAGMITLRTSINRLIDLDKDALSGEYSRSLISFLNLVVIGAVDAVDLGKEMYNEKFKEFELYAKDVLDYGGEAILIEDGIYAICDYSYEYKQFLAYKIDEVNVILDNVRNNMSFVNRPTGKDDIIELHQQIDKECNSLREDMLTVAQSDRPDEMKQYFEGMNKIISYMSECIYPTEIPPIKFNPADLTGEEWYIKHNISAADYYRSKDYDYFISKDPNTLPVLMKFVLSEKLASALTKTPPDLESIENFIKMLRDKSIAETEFNHEAIRKLGYYMNVYSDMLLDYGNMQNTIISQYLSTLGPLPPGLFPAEIQSALGRAEAAYILSDLLFEFSLSLVELVTVGLHPNPDYLNISRNLSTLDIKIIPPTKVSGEYALRISNMVGDELMVHTVYSGDAKGYVRTEEQRKADQKRREESERRQQNLNGVRRAQASILLENEFPGISQAITAVEVGGKYVDYLKEKSISDEEYQKRVDDMVRDSEMLSDGVELGPNFTKTPSGLPHFHPTVESHNMLYAINAAFGTNFQQMDMNDPEKLKEIEAYFAMLFTDNDNFEKSQRHCQKDISSEEMYSNANVHGNVCGI